MEARINTPTIKESSIVERVARIFSSVRGAKPDYTRLAAELETTIPFDVFGVVLLRHDREGVRVTVCQRESGGWVASYRQHPLQDSLAEQLIESPTTLIRDYPDGLDGAPAQCGDALSGFPHLRSTLIAPLVAGDNVLGTLELGSVHPHTYDNPALQRLIEAVVRVLANAIEGAQVGGSAAIQDRQREALKSVSSALTSQADLLSILNQIATGVAQTLNVASAIVTFDQHTGVVRLETQCGLDEMKLRVLVEQTESGSEDSIIYATLHPGQLCVSTDISKDERFPASHAFASELGVRSIYSHPLMAGTRVYGALLLCAPDPGGFTPLKVDILSLFATQATIAIHNRMVIESAHQRSRFQKAIEQLQHAREQQLDDPAVLARLAQETESAFGINLSSLLYFISEHLLTRGERDLHAVLHPSQVELPSLTDSGEWQREAIASALGETGDHDSFSSEDATLAFLTRAAEDASSRAELFDEMSRLLARIKQTPGHANDAVCVTDARGLCVYLDPSAELFCGKPKSVALGSPLTEVFSFVSSRIRNADEVHHFLLDFLRGSVSRQDLRCVLAAEPVQSERERNEPLSSIEDVLSKMNYKTRGHHHMFQRRDPTETDQYYQFSRYPLLNAQGTEIASVLQIHDVTGQVRDEKNKSALLSTVSHELRTPLTAIKAAVTGLLQPDIAWNRRMQRELLEEVNTETDRLTLLVNAVIDMSRIEMGALVLEKAWSDVVEILDGALIRQQSALAGHSLRIYIQPDLPLVFIDHLQMERVFVNLIDNAVHRSPPGGEIVIAMAEENDASTGSPSLRVRVIDQGQPVSNDEQERIFNTFYGRNGHGLGLSLAICRGIVEAHQGTMAVEDGEGGCGACFTFVIPTHSRSSVSSLSGEDLPVYLDERSEAPANRSVTECESLAPTDRSLLEYTMEERP